MGTILSIICSFSFLANSTYVELVKSNRHDEASIIQGLCRFDAQHFFYRAISAFKVKDYKLATKMAEQALFDKDIPERYSEVLARLIEEIKQLEGNKLADIASDMRLSEERMNVAKGGKKTQEIQKRIIAKLDDQIKEIEDELNKASQSAQSGSNQPKIPASDSKIIEEKPPEGQISNRKLVAGGEWGSLPKKENIKISEELRRTLPAHIVESAEGFSKALQNPKINKNNK